jgi:hypothetical protein
MDERVEGTSNRDSHYPNREKFPKKKKNSESLEEDKDLASNIDKDGYEHTEAPNSNQVSYGNNPNLKNTILKKINAPKDDLPNR